MIRSVAHFFLMSLAVVWFSRCGSEDSPKEEQPTPVPVRTTKVTPQPIAYPMTYSGTVEPIDKVSLSTKATGWIDKIYVEEGQSVQKGAPLIKVRSKDIEAKRGQVEAAIAEAQAHFKNAETNFQRIKTLYEKKAATQKELDDTQTAFDGARARLNAVQARKKEIEEMLQYTFLKAPFDGSVTRKMLDAGDLANPGQPILQVENSAKVKVVAKVPEKEIQALRVGMPVRILIPASHIGSNDSSVTYPIDRIVPSADPLSRQFDVHVIVDNSAGSIKPGMFARVQGGSSEGALLMVPKQAVFRRGQLQGLYVVNSENIAHLRWIRTGMEDGDQVEITSGLTIGEAVVIEGGQLLTDGQPVEVRK